MPGNRNKESNLSAPDKKQSGQLKKKAKQFKKQRKAEARAEKKRQKMLKKQPLPLHKRPIICPPDKIGRSAAFRIVGYVCRALVVFAGSCGLLAFVCDALLFDVNEGLKVPNGYIVGISALLVALFALMQYGKIHLICGGAVAVGLSVWQIAVTPNLITDLYWGVLTVYNGAMDRLSRVGYLVYSEYRVPVNSSTDPTLLYKYGVFVLALIVCAVFAFSLIRKTKIWAPAIISTLFLVAICTFNIYSNRIESNLGIVLVIVSFAAILIMYAFDRQYMLDERSAVRDKDRYDTGVTLFEQEDRPTLPAGYTDKRLQKKRAKAAASGPAVQVADSPSEPEPDPDAPVTVADELDAYFTKKPKKSSEKKEKKKRLTPEEKKRQKEIKAQVAAYYRYENVTVGAKRAMGGVAAAMALAVCLLAILIPALCIKGNFSTIESIDEKMAFARDYVTALLRGDDAALDELEYGADGKNFTPHSTDLQQLEFTGKQIFYVKARYSTNYYLTGWIGTDYQDGAWHTGTGETLDAYRQLFDTDESPSQQLRYDFYHFMKPSAVDDNAYTDNMLSKYKSNLEYGFVNTLVHLRRVNSPSTLCYFPSVKAVGFDLYDFDTTDASPLTYVNYYDGIYTGRKFKSGTSYASYTYATVMTKANWSENVGALAEAYALNREALFIDAGIRQTEDGPVGTVKLSTFEENDGTVRFNYENTAKKTDKYLTFCHRAETVSKVGNIYTIETGSGTLRLELNNGYVTDVQLLGATAGNGNNLLYLYRSEMTDAERAELNDAVNLYNTYTTWVYQTYTQKADSPLISDLAKTVMDQAHVTDVFTELVTETYAPDETPDEPDGDASDEDVPGDPDVAEDEPDAGPEADAEQPEPADGNENGEPQPEETDADDEVYSYYVTRKIDTPADVTLAKVLFPSDREVFVQRDLLVRNVIDYLITELGCTYTITPDLSSVDPELDGVENFLQNTHEGYCVQFASACALILREYGIPARYVEGYIATGLTKADRNDFIYGTYVHDYEAHAWIEVWFDGIGWVQYETTPQYYVGMYGADGIGSDIDVKPIVETETDKPYQPLDDETVPEDESESESATGFEDDGTDPEALRGLLIGFFVLVGIGVIAVVIGTVVSKARDAENQRQSIAFRILDEHFGEHTGDSDRREMALVMIDSVSNLLRLYGLSPQTGEFADEYCDRLYTHFATRDAQRRRVPDGDIPLPDLHRVYDAIYAEEFGHGMSFDECREVAKLYLYLRVRAGQYLTVGDRFILHYFKHQI